jgi:hypothetical protein
MNETVVADVDAYMCSFLGASRVEKDKVTG